MYTTWTTVRVCNQKQSDSNSPPSGTMEGQGIIAVVFVALVEQAHGMHDIDSYASK